MIARRDYWWILIICSAYVLVIGSLKQPSSERQNFCLDWDVSEERWRELGCDLTPVTSEALQAKAVKIHHKHPFAIAEIQLFSNEVEVPRHSLAVLASSESEKKGADFPNVEFAIDGNRDTYFQSAKKDTNPSLTISLSSSIEITSIKIKSSRGCCDDDCCRSAAADKCCWILGANVSVFNDDAKLVWSNVISHVAKVFNFNTASGAGHNHPHQQLQQPKLSQSKEPNEVTLSESDPLNFMGKSFTVAEWAAVQEEVACVCREGKWVETHPKDSSVAISCANPFMEHKGCSGNDAERFIWKVSPACDKFAFLDTPTPKIISEKHEICRVLDGRPIIFVGDSIQQTFAYSLLEATSTPCKDSKLSVSASISCATFPDVGVFFARNDRLSLHDDRWAHWNQVEGDFLETPWSHLLEAHPKALVIINRGAHFEPTPKVLDDLTVTLTYITEQFPNASVVWRNTPHGHVDFAQLADGGPLAEAPTAPEIYNYSHFRSQNEEVRDFLRANYPQVWRHINCFYCIRSKGDVSSSSSYSCCDSSSSSVGCTCCLPSFSIGVNAIDEAGSILGCVHVDCIARRSPQRPSSLLCPGAH